MVCIPGQRLFVSPEHLVMLRKFAMLINQTVFGTVYLDCIPWPNESKSRYERENQIMDYSFGPEMNLLIVAFDEIIWNSFERVKEEKKTSRFDAVKTNNGQGIWMPHKSIKSREQSSQW